MKTINSKLQFASLALLGVIIVLVLRQPSSSRPVEDPAATPVATFDLEKVFNTIDQKKVAFADVPKLADQLQAASDEKRKELEAMKTDLGIYTPGSAKYKELEEKLELASQEYRADVEFSKMKIETARGKALKRVYLEIRSAVHEFAKKYHYGLVLVDDSASDIPLGSMEDLNRQISARRVVYTSVDITDELISFMNEQFKASGGVVPAAAAPAPKAAAAGNNKPAKP